MRSIDGKHVAALVTISAFLVLQFVVPLIQYPADTPQRWGWQMYSRTPDPVQLFVVGNDGSERMVPISDHLVRFRWELQFDAETLQEICNRELDSMALRVVHELRDHEERFECGA